MRQSDSSFRDLLPSRPRCRNLKMWFQAFEFAVSCTVAKYTLYCCCRTLSRTYILVHIRIYTNAFFRPFGIFFSSGCGYFLVLSVPWHAGSPPGPRARVWALAEVRGRCSGRSKSHVPSGRHSEHVEASRPLQTHVQVKIMSGGYNLISGILNVINVVRHYLLGDGKVFPRH